MFGVFPELSTERLQLRRLELADAEAVFDYASDPEVARHVTWPAHRTVADSVDFIRHALERYEAGGVAPWGMVLKPSGQLIGTCDYTRWLPQHACAEIGYALSRAYWGQGLAPEAVGALIRFGFSRMQLNRIQAMCMAQNLASERVMQKVGMQYEGTLRQYLLVKGNYCDLKVYSLLRTEWAREGRL